MTILEYFDCEDQGHWLEEIGKSDWRAGRYLYELLKEHRLKQEYGRGTRLLLLTEGDRLIAFCTYAERDEIPEPEPTPWAGFVYTFPAYRGHRYMGILLAYAESLARAEGRSFLYISTGEIGLYEKYGYSFQKIMKDRHGEDTRVYRREV